MCCGIQEACEDSHSFEFKALNCSQQAAWAVFSTTWLIEQLLCVSHNLVGDRTFDKKMALSIEIKLHLNKTIIQTHLITDSLSFRPHAKIEIHSGCCMAVNRRQTPSCLHLAHCLVLLMTNMMLSNLY